MGFTQITAPCVEICARCALYSRTLKRLHTRLLLSFTVYQDLLLILLPSPNGSKLRWPAFAKTSFATPFPLTLLMPRYYLNSRLPVSYAGNRVLALAVYLISPVPNIWPLWIGGYGEENEDDEGCCGGCGARKEVREGRSRGVHDRAAHPVGEDLPDAEAQKPYGEHATQEGVGHPLLEDGVGGHVLGAVGDPGHSQRAEREAKGGREARSDERQSRRKDPEEVQGQQPDPVSQRDHEDGAEHHAAPVQAGEETVTGVAGVEGLLGKEDLCRDRDVDRQHGEEGSEYDREWHARAGQVGEPGPQVFPESGVVFLTLWPGQGDKREQGRGGQVGNRVEHEGGIDAHGRHQQASEGRTSRLRDAERGAHQGVGPR